MSRARRPAPPAIAAVAGMFGRDLDACAARIERAILRARARGARVIVFPEAALGGYLYEPAEGEAAHGVAPPPPLPAHHDLFRRLSLAAGPAVVCVGYTEAAPGGPYASAVCLSGDGILGHHRKVHIPPAEQATISAGDGFAAFDTPAGRIGMLVCYDKFFPEAARALALDGAEIIACLSAWPVCRARPSRRVGEDRQVRHFDALDVVRAIENQVVWVSSNQHGTFGRLRFPGRAKVVCPDGRILATTGSHAGTALAAIDVRAELALVRGELCHLDERLPATYPADPMRASAGRPAPMGAPRQNVQTA
jgi:predicted amidohydrolase